MTAIYCTRVHRAGSVSESGSLCAPCTAFLDYARHRLEKCPYGEAKPACSECPIHCYGNTERAQAKAIMRFSGPGMLLRHPVLAVMHFWDIWRASSRIQKFKKRPKIEE